MRILSRISIPIILLLLSYGESTTGSVPPASSQHQKGQDSCLAGNPVRSTHILYLGNGDPKNVLHLEFPLSSLTSNLSSFYIRTYDSEGIIFHGSVGGNNWFVLGIRDQRLEIQMSNGNGQMVLSKWGPPVSNGKWQKVTVDSSINTIDVRLNGEIVVMLTHHVKNEPVTLEYANLDIILGDLPANSKIQLLRPLNPALDACMKDWAWVKKSTQVLDDAMETDENRQCFENEEPGTFFPVQGYAIFKPNSFLLHTREPWHLSIQLSFRVLEDGGLLLALNGAGSTSALTITLDSQKQVLEASLLDKLEHSVTFPPGICLKHWHTVDVLIQANQLVLKTEEATSSMDMPPADFKALEDIWVDPNAYISVGGMAEHSEQGNLFSGCLKITLQGKAADLDTAHYKHPHVRSHSCPVIVTVVLWIIHSCVLDIHISSIEKAKEVRTPEGDREHLALQGTITDAMPTKTKKKRTGAELKATDTSVLKKFLKRYENHCAQCQSSASPAITQALKKCIQNGTNYLRVFQLLCRHSKT
ncbi:PREDICTED: growth arrest-specific protein 6-like [Nanorana parkeri]|uniref:growth arrest-specific protein 6-like n=1 Tax=Nanorana parkeri TaxID=125878 RepID=UPI0008545C5A|nr:PREDICTED: growth arrest-specific protein 6-like [Nanorana parkeri]